MHIIVVRHYKTVKNATNKIMGWANSPPAKGWRKDVSFIERVFRDKNYNFSTIYTSELERAKRTGLHYAKVMRKQKRLVFHTPELNEVNYGNLSNKSKLWVERNVPQHKVDPDFVYPLGESFRQMQDRSVRCFDQIARKHEHQTVLVVIHAGTIRGLVCHYLNLAYENHLKVRTSHRYIGNFEFRQGIFTRYSEHGSPSGFFQQPPLPVTDDSDSRG